MADTAAQAQARKVIGLPDDQEWTDANVRGHLRRQGFTDPSFTNEVLANGAGTSDSIKNMTPVNVFKGYNFSPNSVIKASDPMDRNSQFIDSRTGQAVTGGGLTADQRTLLSTSGKHKTYETDVETGKRTETTQHPWRDAAKNAAMIFGPSVGAGVLAGMGAFGASEGIAGAGYGGGGASTMAGTAGANFGAGAGTAAGTGAAAGGHSLATAMALNAAENAAMTKASGGSWGQALASGAIGAGTAGLAPGLGTLGPAARTAANFGISQGASAAMRAVGGGNKNSTSTYGRGTESTGIGPTQGRMQQGFGYSTSNPDLSSILKQGQREAVRDQPFRRGYDITTGYNDDKTPITYSMPPIGKYAIPRNGGGQRKKKSVIGDALTINGSSDSGSGGSDGGSKQPESY